MVKTVDTSMLLVCNITRPMPAMMERETFGMDLNVKEFMIEVRLLVYYRRFNAEWFDEIFLFFVFEKL